MITIHIKATNKQGATIGRDTFKSKATTSHGRARAFDQAMEKAQRLWPGADSYECWDTLVGLKK